MNNFLNKFTLYRLTFYYLIGLIFFVFFFSFFGLVPFGPLDVVLSAAVILLTGITTNYIFAGILEAKTNMESVWITLLILILIFPINFPGDIGFAMFAAILAIASKYLLTVERRHIFNPVAVSAVAITLLYPDKGAIWWIGIPIMLPIVILGGLLLIKKLRGWNVTIAFLATYLIATAIGTFLHGGSFSNVFTGWQMGIAHSALLFFTFVMLTEPLTSPPNKQKRVYFAILVALLYSTIQMRILGISLTPETALVLGNIHAFFARHKKVIPQSANNPQVQIYNGNISTI